jgi:uncharacterized repeat protein (TIGR01451 family)
MLFTLVVMVDPVVAQGTTLSTIATAPSQRADDLLWCTGATVDPDSSNNSATATATVSGPADLAVSLSASPEPVTAGGDLTYALKVTNAGPYDAENITLTDYFDDTLVSFSQDSGPLFALATPDTSCASCRRASIAAFAAGATAGFTLVVRVSTYVPSWGRSVNNYAYVTSATGDPNRSNDSTSVRSTVVPAP